MHYFLKTRIAENLLDIAHHLGADTVARQHCYGVTAAILGKRAVTLNQKQHVTVELLV